MERYRYCPNCGAEYRAGFERCSDCDVELTDEAPAPEVAVPAPSAGRVPGTIDPESDLVEVYRSSSTDAEGIRAFLEGHGIEAVAIGEGTIGAYSFNVGPLGERRVMVRVENAADARQLIDQVRGPIPAPEDAEEPFPTERRGLGFPAAVLAAVAIVITIGIVLAYMPGTP